MQKRTYKLFGIGAIIFVVSALIATGITMTVRHAREPEIVHSSPIPQSTPAVTPPPTLSPGKSSEISDQNISDLRLCGLSCKKTGEVQLTHPIWGPIHLISLQYDLFAEKFPSQLVALDSSFKIYWRVGIQGLTSLAMASPGVDATGHIFLTYSDGKDEGVIVLKPTDDGFEDFASRPTTENLKARFYNSKLDMDPQTNTYQIIVPANSCQPTCTTSDATSKTYQWVDGDYRDIAGTGAASSTTAPANTSSAPPTLGIHFTPYTLGYGEVQPVEINNAGDGSGVVTNIRWDSWGDPKTVGHGTALWVPEGASSADGKDESAEVIAFDLGDCNGQWAYRKVTWFFPQHAQVFDPSRAFDSCKGF